MEIDAELKSKRPFANWRFDHVGLRASDFTAAVSWYTEKLGFSLISQAKVGELTIGLLSPSGSKEFLIELIVAPDIQSRPYDTKASFKINGWHHVCLRSQDLDQDLAELKRREVTIVVETREIKETGIRFALFSDPWGNVLELIEPLER